jgi:predicted nucleotide-binding protein
MLRVSPPIVAELLDKSIEQGQDLIERASLIGDFSDYESWKTTRKQWIELTAEGLTRVYDGPEEAEEFKRAASVLPGGRQWQVEYKRDSKAVREAIDVLSALENQLGLSGEDEDRPGDAPGPPDGAEPTDDPRLESQLAGEPADEEHAEESPLDSQLAGKPTDRMFEPDPDVDWAGADEDALDLEPAAEHAAPVLAPERAPEPEPARAPSVGVELAPAPSGDGEFANASANASANGSAPLPATTTAGLAPGVRRQVFLVHGRNEKFKLAVGGLLERAGPHEVTILNERGNDHRKLVEHFEEQPIGTRYAVVLLTADDVGAPRLDSDREPYFSPRARQGVVFEMGVLVAALTPRCMCVLYEDGVELPCDMDGIAYVRLDLAGTWQSKLLLHLRSAGFDYDLNALAPL